VVVLPRAGDGSRRQAYVTCYLMSSHPSAQRGRSLAAANGSADRQEEAERAAGCDDVAADELDEVAASQPGAHAAEATEQHADHAPQKSAHHESLLALVEAARGTELLSRHDTRVRWRSMCTRAR